MSPRPKKPSPLRSATPADGPREFPAGALGGGAGALAMALFVYPSRAYPIQSLMLTLLALAVAAALLGRALVAGRASALRALGGPAALATGALAVWSLARWRACGAPGIDGAGWVWISSPGRPAAAAFALLPAAFALGLGLTLTGREEGARAAAGLRWALIAAGAAFALLGIYQYFIGYGRELAALEEDARSGHAMAPLMEQSLRHALAERRVGGRLGNGNLFAALLAALAAFGFAEAPLRRDEATPRRIAAALSGALCVAAILLTRSRGGMLTLLLALAGAAWIQWRARGGGPRLGRRAAIAAAVVVGAAGLLILAARGSGWAERLGNSETVAERGHYWRVALTLWKGRPLGGAGLGAFELNYPALKPPRAHESRYAHSWIFHTGAETGAVGVGLFTLMWASLGWMALRARGRGSDATAEKIRREMDPLALAIALLCFNGLFDYTLQWREFLILAGVLGGALTGLNETLSSPAPISLSPARAAAGWGGLGMIALCALAALWLAPPLQMAAFWEWEADGAARVGEGAEARRLYERALAWTPDNAGLVASSAMALADSRDPAVADPPAEAARRLDRAAAMNPLSPRLRAERAILLRRQGRLAEAIAKLGEAVALYPDDAGYRLDRADALLEAKRPADAATDLSRLAERGLLVWEYQRPRYLDLCRRAGIAPAKLW